jgi:hypothetical protein
LEEAEKKKTGIERAGEDLFNFAVDREDVKALMVRLPAEAATRRVTVEYELQILRIVGVGWCISYYLQGYGQKDRLGEFYWKAVHGFSQGLSETTRLMTGQNIDYFQILRDRLDMYLDALRRRPDAAEPAAVIGPEFAEACGNIDDVYTVMTGARMFIATIGSVTEYLQAVRQEWEAPGLPQ